MRSNSFQLNSFDPNWCFFFFSFIWSISPSCTHHYYRQVVGFSNIQPYVLSAQQKPVVGIKACETPINTNSRAIHQILLASHKQINLRPVIILSLWHSIHLNILDKWWHESFPATVFDCAKEPMYVDGLFFANQSHCNRLLARYLALLAHSTSGSRVLLKTK